MPALTLINTPTGPRYHLDGQALSNNDGIELRTERFVTESGWLRGKFLWTGDVNDQPYIYNMQCGTVIDAGAEVRWIDVEPSPPPAGQPIGSADTMKDWERRGG